jgi:hypothetical protein
MGKMKDITIHIEELENECGYLTERLNILKWQRETLIQVLEGCVTEEYSHEAVQKAIKEANSWKNLDNGRSIN